jgi:hypothetical protein
MTPAPTDEHEALLREARDTADRLRLILDINNTIVANLELHDLLQAHRRVVQQRGDGVLQLARGHHR